MPKSPKSPRSPKWKLAFKCIDCGGCTLDMGEYYMVHFEMWLDLVGDLDAGMLCIGCFETRLGRELTPADFLDCPLNQSDDPGDKSPRLRQRLGFACDAPRQAAA